MNSVKTKFILKGMAIPTAVKDKKGRIYWYKEKQNPEKLSELIMNYEDLKQQFLGTPWEVHFEN